jgi:hypothetical protein
MNYTARRKYRPTRGERVLAAGMGFITSVLGLAAWLALRSFVVGPLVRAFVSPLARNWVNDAFLIPLGILWLVLVYLSFYGYQKAAERRRLWLLFARITLIEVGVPLVGSGIAIWLVHAK